MSGTIGSGDVPRNAVIRVHEFWKEYAGAPGENLRETHWCRWSKAADFHYNQQVENVARIKKPIPGEFGGEEFSPLWLAIRPQYEAWLAGQELPVNGTPLDAWSALNKRQVTAIREAGLRSVEELAACGDNELTRIRIPDARKARNLARQFVEHKDGGAHIEAALATRDETIAKQQEEIAEMRRLVDEMAGALKATQAAQAKAA